MVGVVEVALTVERDGVVSSLVQGLSGVVAPSVLACVERLLRQARFAPPPDAQTTLTLPVHFLNNVYDGPSVVVGRPDPGF
jgi:hypothetical protein